MAEERRREGDRRLRIRRPGRGRAGAMGAQGWQGRRNQHPLRRAYQRLTAD